MTSERKVSASLNPAYEADRYILAKLPDKNISEVIKLALVLWYEIQEQDRIVIDRDEYDQLRQSNSPTSALASMALDIPAITKAISDGIAQGIAKAGIQGIASIPTNGNSSAKPAQIDDEREDPNDPLVRALMGLSWEDV